MIVRHYYIPEMAAAQEDDWNLNIDSAVGIDLGTTYSCVSVYKDGRITVIPDENGNKLIPSVVAFESNSRGEIERLVGRDATENEGIDQSHIVTEVKRLIGRKFDEPAVHENIKRWPFQVTASSEGNAQILLDFDGQHQVQYSPEYISYSILKKLKEMATNYLGKVKERRRILVMDVGGGTSDVALIRVAGEKFTVLACEGDNNVGGEDFDTNLVDYCVEQIKEKFGSDVKIGNLQMRRLRNKCKQAKHKLSENPDDPNLQYVLELDDFIDDTHDITLPISRNKFEDLNQDLFDRALGLVTSCLNDAKLSISDITDLVPIGGSMRVPKLREMLEELFGGKQLCAYINPDEAVSVGAAIFAAQQLALYRGHIVVSDITPFSLGILSEEDNRMSVIIPRNTKIPCKKTDSFETSHDYQTAGAIVVYQGENEFVKNNMFLGNFEIENLNAALAGETRVDVTLEVDTNGILKVTAREVAAEKENVVNRSLEGLKPHLNILNVPPIPKKRTAPNSARK
ncbi:hypothetical protein B566_EDAN013977 [Ephemera danica]|nr:hypothetical protein B566_EDAN013977 [Ephemera danica]